MRATGIICEYNPFHHGHRYHIEQTRKLTNCECLVCVMSGNFVQRGEPAIIDKWERAKVAIQQGCDLVIELPFAFCVQSAKQFAQGGIVSLSLAQVEAIVFGSEINDMNMLQKLTDIDASSFQDLMSEGLSPVKAYETIYGTMNANDILGINYLQALKQTSIQPYCIKRTNAYHDEELHGSIASATAIRKAIKAQEDVVQYTCMSEQLHHCFHLEQYYPLLQTILLTQDAQRLASLFLVDEGIENRMIQIARSATTMDEFIQAMISKRYTRSRIQRTIIHILNQTKKQDVDTLDKLSHIRILAFNEIGKTYLKELKEHEVIIASRFNQIPLCYRNMEMKASQVYAYPLENRKEMMDKELQSPIYLPVCK